MSAFVINPYAFGAAEDADAAAYLNAVEAEDGQALEAAVRKAVDDFVKGLKADGIWSAIKASCILAGARTLDGALVPLVGAAPTNNNFVSADYNRETGLKGNGSTKFLATGRNNDDDPQNNAHMAVFYAEPEGAGVTRITIGTGGNSAGATHFGRSSSAQNFLVRNRNGTLDGNTISAGESNVFAGMSRSSSSGFDYRYNATTVAITRTSQTPYTAIGNGEIAVFKDFAAGFFSNARLSFYSIGESLDLADFDTRVSALMTDLAAAI